MTTYLIEVTFCWLLFYALYHLLLRKETFFHLNRFYLLSTLFLGLVLPVLDYSIFTVNQTETLKMSVEPIVVGVQSIENNIEEIVVTPIGSDFTFLHVLIPLYWLGMGIFLLRFLVGVFKIKSIYSISSTEPHSNYIKVNTPHIHLPFSFFNLLFWSTDLDLEKEEADKILKHELVHIYQWHSLDVVFLQILQVLFWCSPLIYFYNRSLRNVHEYLADDEVIQSTSRNYYGRLLIKQSANGHQLALANNFIHSQLKNRIAMMTKNKSRKTFLAKYFFAFPIAVLLFFTFFNKNTFTNDYPIFSEGDPFEVVKDTVYKEVDQMPIFSGCKDVAEEKRMECSQKNLLTFVYTNIKYPEQARKNGTSGTVVVKFVVTKEGYVSRPFIYKGIGDGCDAAVIDIVRKMPEWEPGIKEDKAVNVEFVLPVKFKLEGDAPKEDQNVYKEVDEMPRFPGCEDLAEAERKDCAVQELLKFIYTNIKYPAEAREAGVQGTVVSNFVIDQTGKVTAAKIVKGPDSGLHEAVLKVVNEMPAWIPGKKEGKIVKTEFNLPVKFKIDESAPSIKNNTLKLEELSISPNPSNGQLNVSFKSEKGNVEMQVLDINGKLLKSFSVSTDGNLNKTLDLTQLSKGTVFLKIIQKDQSHTSKVILQ